MPPFIAYFLCFAAGSAVTLVLTVAVFLTCLPLIKIAISVLLPHKIAAAEKQLAAADNADKGAGKDEELEMTGHTVTVDPDTGRKTLVP